MLSRSALGRQTQRAVRQQWQQPAASRRGFAAPASGSFSYETGTATGIKYAARDMPGATSQLAIVAQAGTRYETMPGLTVGLQTFAFKVRRYRHLHAGATISNHDNSTPTGVRLFASSASLSSWVPTSSPTTLAKTSSLVPNSSATTSHTLLSCLPRLPHERDMPVCKI